MPSDWRTGGIMKREKSRRIHVACSKCGVEIGFLTGEKGIHLQYMEFGFTKDMPMKRSRDDYKEVSKRRLHNGWGIPQMGKR
jgi:hypothetical protein